MNKQPLTYDLGLWMLLGMNGYLIWYFTQHPTIIDTVVFIFWMQSVLIGVFNFLNMLTLKHFSSDNFTMNGQKVESNGCAALFFAVHYGIFHLVYFFFLPSIIKYAALDWQFIKLSFIGILLAGTVQFLQDKAKNRVYDVNIGAMFFMPYARVVPMHLMILIPSFFHISAPIVFLLLKTIADAVMHIVYQRYVFRFPESS